MSPAAPASSSPAPVLPPGRCVDALRARLAAVGAAATLGARADALAALARWLVAGPRPPTTGAAGGGAPPATARLLLLVHALEADAVARSWLGSTLRSYLAEARALRLLCEVGLPNDRGIGPETSDRLARRLLPTAPDPADLAQLLARCLRSPAEIAWLVGLPGERIEALAALLDAPPVLAPELVDRALRVLTTRVAALGLTEELRDRSGLDDVSASPFFALPRAAPAELPALAARCRAMLEAVHEHMEQRGVSVDVVYRLEVIARGLDRVDALLPLASTAAPAPGRARVEATLLAALAMAQLRDRRLVDLFRSNLRLLARKVIERAGATGEHYVTATRREYVAMLISAAGGGVLTAATCALKFLIKWAHLPLFLDGLLASANYAGSFLAMQLCGLTLATKQPSMTAATLAAALGARDDAFVHVVARICRSQLAAAIGNLATVVPAALALDAAWRRATGRAFLDPAAAVATLRSLDPLASGTVPFAALTGVLLWWSSLGAGWLENWAVYRRLPEAIEGHRLGLVLGRRATRWLAGALRRHVSGVGGNATLGGLLGMTPVLGAFTGLPLDVRHVTLSMGALALAARALAPDQLPPGVLGRALAGVALIGLLNFGVSFALALTVALRARGIDRVGRLRVLGALARHLRRAPREFFLPPRATPPTPPT